MIHFQYTTYVLIEEIRDIDKPKKLLETFHMPLNGVLDSTGCMYYGYYPSPRLSEDLP